MPETPSRFTPKLKSPFIGRTIFGLSPNRALLVATVLVIGIGTLTYWIGPDTPQEKTAVITVYAGIVGAFVLLYNAQNSNKALVNSQTTLEYAQRSLEQLQVSSLADRFNTAVEQTAHQSEAVRIAGIYTLSSLAQLSDDHYRPAIDVMMWFVRSKASITPDDLESSPNSVDRDAIRPDVQAAIDALGKRRADPTTGRRAGLDFSNRDLDGYSFVGGWFADSRFFNSWVRTSDFTASLLDGSDFTVADCDRADFSGASLRGVRFEAAKLIGATFFDPLPNGDYDSLTARQISLLHRYRMKVDAVAVFSEDELKAVVGKDGDRLTDSSFGQTRLAGASFKFTNLSQVRWIEEWQVLEMYWDSTTVLPQRFELERIIIWKKREELEEAGKALWGDIPF